MNYIHHKSGVDCVQRQDCIGGLWQKPYFLCLGMQWFVEKFIKGDLAMNFSVFF